MNSVLYVNRFEIPKKLVKYISYINISCNSLKMYIKPQYIFYCSFLQKRGKHPPSTSDIAQTKWVVGSKVTKQTIGIYLQITVMS